MKREILCDPCAQRTTLTITGCKFVEGQIMHPYPGEHKKFVTGTLTRSCLCDSCSKKLEAGNEATALSIWADYGGIPYYPWESEFFETVGDNRT